MITYHNGRLVHFPLIALLEHYSELQQCFLFAQDCKTARTGLNLAGAPGRNWIIFRSPPIEHYSPTTKWGTVKTLPVEHLCRSPAPRGQQKCRETHEKLLETKEKLRTNTDREGTLAERSLISLSVPTVLHSRSWTRKPHDKKKLRPVL